MKNEEEIKQLIEVYRMVLLEMLRGATTWGLFGESIGEVLNAKTQQLRRLGIDVAQLKTKQMNISKDLFDDLRAERQAADMRLFHIDAAIDALQALCDHEWEEDDYYAGQYESASCKICGKDYEENNVKFDKK